MSSRQNRRALIHRHGKLSVQQFEYQMEVADVRQSPELGHLFWEKPILYIASEANLKLAYKNCRQAGQGAGPDGLSYDDYGDGFGLIDELREELLSGTYVPGKESIVPIPKRLNGYRTLVLQNVRDRVVQRATLQVLLPWMDPAMVGLSFGSRPGLSVNHALAMAGVVACETQAGMAIIEDLSDAFGTLRPQRVLELLKAEPWASPALIEFLERLLSTPSTQGLRQGAATSPLLLNYFLNKTLDLRWAKTYPEIPLLRYVDDLLLLIPSKWEHRATAIYAALKEMVEWTGFKLKGQASTAIQDWSRRAVPWLGFGISRPAGKDLQIEIQGCEAQWIEELSSDLLWCHSQAAAPLLAAKCVEGQIERLGPCDDPAQVRAYIRTAIDTAERLDFTELPTAAEFVMKWERSRAAFQRLQQLAPIWFAARRYQDKFTVKNLQPRKTAPEVNAKDSATAPHPIKLYVDGSCGPGTGCGGWAAITIERTGPQLRRSGGGKAAARVRSGRQFRCWSGGLSNTTNNEAELAAAYKGLSGINPAHQITLHTDSRYVYDGLQRIILEHRKHGPHVGSMFFKPPAVHGALWLKLEEVISRLKHPLRIVKLLGHTGNKVHDRCDSLAKEAMYRVQALQSVGL